MLLALFMFTFRRKWSCDKLVTMASLQFTMGQKKTQSFEKKDSFVSNICHPVNYLVPTLYSSKLTWLPRFVNHICKKIHRIIYNLWHKINFICFFFMCPFYIYGSGGLSIYFLFFQRMIGGR